MSRRWLATGSGILAAIVLLVLLQHRLNSRLNPANAPLPDAATSVPQPSSGGESPSADSLRAGPAIQSGRIPENVSTAAASNSAAPALAASPAEFDAALEFTNFPAATVMENMRGAIHAYAVRFNGNPVGTNPEIAAALNGGNPGQAKFLRAEDGLRLNERGELVDPWGTPFFFHQLSAKEMEIHSAGPDKVMWTADDLVSR